MLQQPIKIPKIFPPARFSVPLVEGVREREAMEDFDQYLLLLKQWGFERRLCARSINHHHLERAYPHPRIEDYQVWTHPAGIYASLDSYSTEGYTSETRGNVPPKHALGSITLRAIVDIGMGRELQHRAAVGLHFSGGSDPQFDGGCVRSISDTIHSNTGSGLYDFFRTVQQYGKFLPFERWGESKTNHHLHLSLPGEVIAPIEHAPPGQTFDQLMEGNDLPEMISKAKAALPAPLAQIVDIPGKLQPRPAKENQGMRRGPRWDPVDFSINEFSEAMFLAGKRWPKQEESELLAHWNCVAIGEMGDRLDPSRMRAYESGPAGLSLATALLYSKRTASAAEGLLEELLENAPEDVLRRWATIPDAAGYTLALRAVERSFSERMLDSHNPPTVDVLGILYRRLGPEGIVLSTPTRSLMGLISHSRENGSYSANALEKSHSEFAQVVARLDDWGLPWNLHLRWRTYPNLFNKEEGKPAFFQVDGPVDPVQWIGLLNEPRSGPARDA